jgi:hypothetical protein
MFLHSVVAFFAGIVAFFGGMFHSTPPIDSSVSMEASSTTSAIPAASSVITPEAVSASTPAPNSDYSNAAPAVPTPSISGSVSAESGAALPQTGSAWQSTLPLGDGKYVTDAPKKGYVYLCHVATGGGGAEGNASWIHGSTWSPGDKVSVEGAVSWPNATYSMKVSGNTRLITSNGLPTDHATGIFPIQKNDPAYRYDANPNSITAQSYSFSLPASPTALAAPDCIYGQVGIMNDGVPLFDGFDAEYRDAVAHETQDAWEAHPDSAGVYHYHGFSEGIKNMSASAVAGFAFDGYPITGPKLSNGTYLMSKDLDLCHGITSTISLDGKQVSMYHYVLTEDFPYSIACFHAASHEPKPGSGKNGTKTNGTGGQQAVGATSQTAPSGGMPPQAAIDACSGMSSGSACSFTPQGQQMISGTCKMPPNTTSLACVPR